MDAIKYRLRTGRLHRIHAGVYAVGHRRLTQQGRWLAAVLAGGDDAVLSHRYAAAHWGFRETIAKRIDVTAPTRRGNRPGIVFHRAHLHPADRTIHEGIPITSVPRTLLDLAATLSLTQQDYAFWEAERLGLVDPHELRHLLARSHGRRGMRRLRALTERLLPPDVTLRSPLERRFYELIRDAGLPLPALNVSVEGFEVDACWAEQRLVVELDGHAYHRGVDAFERDRIRDAELQAAGYRVIRLTARNLELGVAGTVRPMLER
jgi:hypothetical protein